MLHIAVFVKNLTSGGAEKQAVLLAKAMSGDYEVHYIIFNGEKVHQKYMDMLNEDRRIHVQAFVGGHLTRYKSLVDYLRQNHIKAIFSYLTAANAYACLAGLQVGAKVFTGLRNAELPTLKLWADRFLANRMARLAIANCYSGKANFISKGFHEDKVVVIPNCFEHIKPYHKKPYSDRVRIITVGRFVPQKDYETAIRAIAEVKQTMPDIQYDIVGYGELEAQIRDWVKQYDIADCTHIYINPPNIPELLDGADIYLSTSLFEGTSNSIMEGMNADLPIVATHVGDNDKLVTDGVNGYLCDIRDWQEIAGKLKILITDETQRTSMGYQSKQMLCDGYSMDKFRKSYVQLLSFCFPDA